MDNANYTVRGKKKVGLQVNETTDWYPMINANEKMPNYLNTAQIKLLPWI